MAGTVNRVTQLGQVTCAVSGRTSRLKMFWQRGQDNRTGMGPFSETLLAPYPNRGQINEKGPRSWPATRRCLASSVPKLLRPANPPQADVSLGSRAWPENIILPGAAVQTIQFFKRCADSRPIACLAAEKNENTFACAN